MTPEKQLMQKNLTILPANLDNSSRSLQSYPMAQKVQVKNSSLSHNNVNLNINDNSTIKFNAPPQSASEYSVILDFFIITKLYRIF